MNWSIRNEITNIYFMRFAAVVLVKYIYNCFTYTQKKGNWFSSFPYIFYAAYNIIFVYP